MSTTTVRLKVSLQTAELSHPLTAYPLFCASDFKFINFTLEWFVKYVDEVFMAAVRARIFLFLEPVLEAGLTEVLSTAFSEVRITKNFGADTAVEFLR